MGVFQTEGDNDGVRQRKGMMRESLSSRKGILRESFKVGG